MPVPLHEVAVGTYVRLLATLDATLQKAAAHAEKSGYAAEALLRARLYPDMWCFAEQVQAATNHAARGPARLAGVAPPALDPKSATFDDLRARIAFVRDFIAGLDPAEIEAGDGREIVFPMGEEKRTLTGRQYLLTFSLPNFYFHLTTAYDILRHNGVPLEKTDFTGPI